MANALSPAATICLFDDNSFEEVIACFLNCSLRMNAFSESPLPIPYRLDAVSRPKIA